MAKLTKDAPCCEMMASQLNHVCDQHPDPYDCPDHLVVIAGGEAGLIVHDGGSSMVLIEYCPWCAQPTGTKIRDPET